MSPRAAEAVTRLSLGGPATNRMSFGSIYATAPNTPNTVRFPAPPPSQGIAPTAQALALFGCATALEILFWIPTFRSGWPVLEEKESVVLFIERSLESFAPPAVCALLSLYFGSLLTEVRTLQPLVNLIGEGRPTHRTVRLTYADKSWFTVPLFAWGNGDTVVWLAWTLSLVSMLLQPFVGALYSVHSVWLVSGDHMVMGFSQVGLNPSVNFMDMISFQGASGFAAATVLYDGIGVPPFVDSHGYTVEAFELPHLDTLNSTVLAEVGAIRYQASCESPISLEIFLDGGLYINTTAIFGDCHVPLKVAHNGSDVFGVTALPDVEECQTFASQPLQYRPVLFYFLSDADKSLVMCTPSLAAATVSIQLDAQSNVTSVLSATDITLPSDMARNIYNGLFFNEDDLESDALARLSGIQQQIPSAILQLARLRYDGLPSTDSLTNATTTIYNTYLSLVAKSVYMVSPSEPLKITVRVGSMSLLNMFSPLITHLFVVTLVVLFIGTVILHHIHRSARGALSPPPGWGSLAGSLHLLAEPEVRAMLDEAYHEVGKGQDGSKADSLVMSRWALDDDTGRVVVIQAPHQGQPA
ncbi:uncharacterized protein BXZ73DRAFT_75174 [Epithele typhae]|uniref:uncharacterized protein n=1 Tax=Epithele typhae TaxID=378194 RepID=UPI00200783C2|nr:uncharacterized protein BXZ73DRAFT_75174 [Epithele typhae]KAH9941211.1 hypothetical protein BXZ73DRAFT_75174 [Epithele typhae]